MRLYHNRFFRFIFCTLLLTGVFTAPFASYLRAEGRPQLPEPNPPADRRPADLTTPSAGLATATRGAPPDTEWTYHKTIDNQHPDGVEQQMVWLMNRARSDPFQEGVWLATMDDPDVAGARSYFNVDLDLLQEEFAAIAAKPPAAFDVRLYQAAKSHSDYLIASDTQSHDGQLDRVRAAGFDYRSYRGNVFSYTRSGVHGHAGFNIDWGGSDGTGMQEGRGHRQAIMSIDGDYTNVGIAVEATSGTSVGPLVTTGNFCNADTGSSDHFNRFLVGTVWQDVNGNDQYDPGEGSGGIEVRPDRGTYYAITADSGGYALPIEASGTYTVAFSGPGLTRTITRSVTLGSGSFLLDLLDDGASGGDPEAITGAASAVSRSGALLNGIVNANGQAVDYYFEYGPTALYGDISNSGSTSANASIQIAVDDLSAGVLYHYRLVVVTDSVTVYGNDRSFTTDSDDGPSFESASGGGGGGGCLIGTVLE